MITLQFISGLVTGLILGAGSVCAIVWKLTPSREPNRVER